MIDFDIDFCPHCGTEINYAANSCPECEEILPEDASFCPYCGVELEDVFYSFVKGNELYIIKKN